MTLPLNVAKKNAFLKPVSNHETKSIEAREGAIAQERQTHPRYHTFNKWY
jgi:hypothetical protein